jgi:fatty acid desaturase
MSDFIGFLAVLVVAGIVAMAAAVLFWVTVIAVAVVGLFVIFCNVYAYFTERKTEDSNPNA